MVFEGLLVFGHSIKSLLLSATSELSTTYLNSLKLSVILIFQQAAQLGDSELSPEQLKFVVVLVIVFALLAIFGLIFVVRSYGVLKKQYGVIESQHQEIADKNEELAFKNESLEELNLEKNNMISVVAHDFKAPLGNIQGLVELIKLNKEALNEDQLNYLELLKKVSQDTAEMVDVMLDVHRIESELHELTLHDYNIIELIDKAIKLQEPTAHLKKLKIILEPDMESYTLKTDKQYFQQIISNILKNAIDFSPEKSTVTILVEDNKNAVSISITDEGPGISNSDQKRLFSGYSKLEGEGEKGKPTGIGLVIVLRLLEKLQGKIDVQSEKGKGSTFKVELLK